MAYSERIKSFDKIRSYMRQFYVFGFKRRGEYAEGSARSYDNERRRMESWLGDCMAFRRDDSGKTVFLSVDSRTVPRNPLYRAFRAKSFTDNDLFLHFHALDLLADGPLSAQALAEALSRRLEEFPQAVLPDDSTVRKKLREYEALGLLESEKRGRERLYRLASGGVDLSAWQDAVDFYAEADPLGVIGSYLLDRYDGNPTLFGFKHHYILHALDSEIVLAALEAIGEGRRVRLTNVSPRSGRPRTHTVFPLRIYVSTQSGRQYLLCWHYGLRRMQFFRMDAVTAIAPGEPEPDPTRFDGSYARFRRRLWGVSAGEDRSLDRLEMDVYAGEDEGYIPQRLEREKRSGSVVQLDAHTWRFTAEVYDAAEMLPWLRTFIGRIVRLSCTNPFVMRTWYDDLRSMARAYGEGEDDAVQ